jgi:EAL domain-containing protein (putative c-di-GMP-specific phosphodiesterase class I)
VTPLHVKAVPVGQEGTGFIAIQTRERLQGRLAAMHAVFQYQPQVDLQTGRVAGMEALICSSLPGKDRPSSELVAEIEASGLGLALMEHWLQKACHDQHFWLGEVGHDFPLGFPVSQRTLLSRGFLPLVQRILSETGLPPEFLELEISEAAFGTSAVTLRALRTLSEAGISIAIDKFSGTKASLCLLTLVPIAKLRIDPSLLRNIGGASPEALLFDGIIGAARGLGMTVCVTGVASEDSLAAILRHARPLAQGMAIGAPLNTEDIIQLLRGSCADTASLQPLVVVDD